MTVALAVFGTKGYHDTSMNEVAEAAGITKPVVYQHFESKHALYLALLADIGGRLRTAIATALATAPGPRELVESGFEAYFEFFGNEPHAFAVLYGDGVRTDSDFMAELVKVEESTLDNIIMVLDVPAIDADNRRALAHGIVGLSERMGRYWLEHEFDVPASEMARRAAELAYYGLRGPKPANI